MQKDSREVTPPLPDRNRAGTLSYKSMTPPLPERYRAGTLLYIDPKISWDDGRESKYFVENEPITIGTDGANHIVIPTNEYVFPKHVTLTLVPGGVQLVTHASIDIYYQNGNTNLRGPFSGTITATKNFTFHLDPLNEDYQTGRYTDFEVHIDEWTDKD